MKGIRMMAAVAVAGLCVSAVVCDVSARKIRSTLKTPKPKARSEVRAEEAEWRIEVVAGDTSSGVDGYGMDMLRYAGYDKEAGSAYETFFIINDTDRELLGLVLTITYRTLEGKQLHKRENVEVKVKIGPGETGRADIRSWDKQKVFYYHRSNVPRKRATPYDVRFKTERYYLGDKRDGVYDLTSMGGGPAEDADES